MHSDPLFLPRSLFGLAPHLWVIVIGMAYALFAGIFRTYVAVGRGRRLLWTLALIGFFIFSVLLVMSVFNRFNVIVWALGVTIGSWFPLIPLARFIGAHRREDSTEFTAKAK